MEEKVKMTIAEYHRMATRITELEDENHQHYKDMLGVNNRREQLEQVTREFCIGILSGSLHVIPEEEASKWDTMNIFRLIEKAKAALDQQLKEWVDLTSKIIKKLNEYEQKESDSKDVD